MIIVGFKDFLAEGKIMIIDNNQVNAFIYDLALNLLKYKEAQYRDGMHRADMVKIIKRGKFYQVTGMTQYKDMFWCSYDEAILLLLTLMRRALLAEGDS